MRDLGRYESRSARLCALATRLGRAVLGLVMASLVLFVVVGAPSAEAATMVMGETDAAPLDLGSELDVSSDEEDEQEVRVAALPPWMTASNRSTRVCTTESDLPSKDETEPPFRPPIH